MNFLLPGFKIRTHPDGTLELVVPRRYRTALFVTSVLGAVLFIVIRANIIVTVFLPLILATMGSINERWYFSRKAEEILHRSGTFFLSKTKHIGLSQIRYVEIIDLTATVRTILPSPFKRELSSLSLVTVTESRIDIEVRPAHYKPLLREKGRHIAEHLGKPIIER